MRQMRLEKREIKDPAELEKVLDACKVVRIGTMDAEGMFIVAVILLHFPVSWETDEFVWWRTRRKRDTDLRF